MARVTKAITQGIKMVGGSNVANYSLHFLSATKKHSVGGFMTVVVPHLTLGRASKCQVRYGDEYPTVSRQHAEIEIRGKDTVIRHLSNVNPTLINGQPIDREWYLNNGDEIQLAHDGPKMRYNATPTRTSNLKLTSRMAMFAEQSLRPYRKAVWVLSSLLVVSLALGSWSMVEGLQAKKANVALKKDFDESQQQIAADKIAFQKTIDENNEKAARDKKKFKNDAERAKAEADAIKKKMDDIINGNISIAPPPPPPPSPEPSPNPDISMLPKENIYFIACQKIEISFPDGAFSQITPDDGSPLLWSGTGFLTNDHKFITARHVLQAWRYGIQNGNEEMAAVSSLELDGAKVVAFFQAVSQSNDFFTFSTEDMIKDDSQDPITDYPGIGKVKYADSAVSDWAYVKLENKSSNITYNRNLSSNLKMGDELYVLGYSYGLATQDLNGDALKPLFSKIMVAQDGLTHGIINATDRSFGPGNSGGPVFVNRNGKFEVVGIVSAGIGSEIGIIVPINVIR